MTTVSFIRHGDRPAGFSISGHSGYAESGADIVCASLSAAAMLTECQLNDVLRLGAATEVDEATATIRVELPRGSGDEVYSKAAPALLAFRRFITQLGDDYKDNISITEE